MLRTLYTFGLMVLLCSAGAAQAQSSGPGASPAKASAPPAASKGKAKEAASHAGAPAKETEPAVGPHEGITVHGHWTVEVRSPDGNLLTHREFENSLAVGVVNFPPPPRDGADLLAMLLGRTATTGELGIGLDGVHPPCFSTSPIILNHGCLIAGSQITRALLPSGGLSLSGTLTADAPGGIEVFNTWVAVCAPSVLPANCTLSSTNSTPLTFDLTGFIFVPLGGIVQVSVVISFS